MIAISRLKIPDQVYFDGDRDAWKSVEGTSTEDAQKYYVEKLLEVWSSLFVPDRIDSA